MMPLTASMRRLLPYIVAGYSYRRISELTGLSPHTIKKRVYAIVDRMDAPPPVGVSPYRYVQRVFTELV